MKYLLPLVILFIVAASCKKKETNHPFKPVSKGDLLMIIASDDSLECAFEYNKVDPIVPFYESPVHIDIYFINGNYRYVIVPTGMEMISVCYVDPLTNTVDNFPVFNGYYPFIDSVPASDLEQNPIYSVTLDSLQIDFLTLHPGWEQAWSLVNNTRIVFEYRKRYPDSRVGYLRLKNDNGEIRNYFFMSKYKV